MAGHSQFKNIMHRKAAQDKKKAKVYTKYIRDIMTAAKQGGGDLSSNPSLRTLVEKARKENMTNSVVERAIKRGTGEIAGADYAERTYEGYGAAGVAVMVTTLTDNPTRTITNVRTAFNKFGGNVGSDGAVAWMFKHAGLFTYPLAIGNEDKVTEAALNAGADDIQNTGEMWEITSAPSDFTAVRDALAKTLGEPTESNLTYIPTQLQAVTDLETAQSIMKMVEMLEADDDVQTVTTNLDLPEDIAAKLQ
ncbi:MAG TPA: YebC/PmpR family DNA-binding transcriptional regulator [Alphaproteobacteria bacterium]|nr:YebC/PmpR family DNA-binding transcriptional regulator [Alphaproteobacteria bacterium]